VGEARHDVAAGGGGDADAGEAADHQCEHGELLRGEDAGGAGLEADEAQDRPDELAADDVEQQDCGDEAEGGNRDPALTPVPNLDQSAHSRRHIGTRPPRRRLLRQPLADRCPALFQRAVEPLPRRLQHPRSVLKP
jgi:hypothetical protein